MVASSNSRLTQVFHEFERCWGGVTGVLSETIGWLVVEWPTTLSRSPLLGPHCAAKRKLRAARLNNAAADKRLPQVAGKNIDSCAGAYATDISGVGISDPPENSDSTPPMTMPDVSSVRLIG